MLKYVEGVESLITKLGNISEKDKKWLAFHYCSTKVQGQWAQLTTYSDDTATFEEFKAELIKAYPECEAMTRGSVAALERYVESMPIMKASNKAHLKEYIREFRAHMGRLNKDRQKVTDREAIGYFLTPLDSTFKQSIHAHLSFQPETELSAYKRAKAEFEAQTANQGKAFKPPELDPDDKYEWKDVVAVADKLCSGSMSDVFLGKKSSSDDKPEKSSKKAVSAFLYSGDVPAEPTGPSVQSINERMDKFEASAQRRENTMRDKLFTEVKSCVEQAIVPHLDKYTADQHREFEAMKQVFEKNSGGPSQFNSGTSSGQGYVPDFVKNSKVTRGMDCFYCWKAGHYIADCEDRKNDLTKGIVLVINGKTVFFDGKLVPKEPKHKSPMEKAREYHERRVVSQNYDEVMETYFGSEDHSIGYEPAPPVRSTSNSIQEDHGLVRVLATMEKTMGRIEQQLAQTRAQGPAANSQGFQ